MSCSRASSAAMVFVESCGLCLSSGVLGLVLTLVCLCLGCLGSFWFLLVVMIGIGLFWSLGILHTLGCLSSSLRWFELLPAVMCLVCILFCWFAPLLCLSSSSSSCWLRLALVLCCCSRLLVFLLLPCGFSSPWGVSALTVGVGVCSLVLWGFCLPWAVSVPRIAVMAAGLFGLLGVLLALVPCGCSPPWCESVLAVGVSVLGLLPTLD